MRRVCSCLLGFVLLLGGCYGMAQTAYEGRPYYGNGFFDDRYWGEGLKVAERFGFEDGVNDGRNDFLGGRRFRPEHSGNYKHADHGYDGRFGDKGRYKDVYRHAYQRGYEEGYRQRGPGRGY